MKDIRKDWEKNPMAKKRVLARRRGVEMLSATTVPTCRDKDWEMAEIICYYSEPDNLIDKLILHNVVLKWIKDGVIQVFRIQHADNCDDVDEIEPKERMFNVVPTKETNGIVHSDYDDAVRMAEWFNKQFADLTKNGLWGKGDAMAYSGCELRFEVKEEWV